MYLKIQSEKSLMLFMASIYSISQQIDGDAFCKSIVRAFENCPQLDPNFAEEKN